MFQEGPSAYWHNQYLPGEKWVSETDSYLLYEGGSKHLWNVGKLQPTRRPSSYSPPRVFEISLAQCCLRTWQWISCSRSSLLLSRFTSWKCFPFSTLYLRNLFYCNCFIQSLLNAAVFRCPQSVYYRNAVLTPSALPSKDTPLLQRSTPDACNIRADSQIH
jgi:hypothetical protein